MKKFICNGTYKHKHRIKFIAHLCGYTQSFLPMDKIYFAYLRIVNPKKLYKILMTTTFARRATQRRIKRGMNPI